MSGRAYLSRRKLSALIASLPAFLVAWPAAATALQHQSSRGAGRTDDPETEPRDRGIGGTGVVGTIRGFGSIIVNGLRITYKKRVRVLIDGRTAQASDLKLGHVVRVNATRRGQNWSTRLITVDSEVVGPVESVSLGEYTVLRQTIIPSRPVTLQVGETVAVSGLRRTSGAIEASLVETRPGGQAKIIGLVTQGDDGEPSIGKLRLMGLPSTLVGQRCIVLGKYFDGALAVSDAQDEQSLLLNAKPSGLLIEAFIRGSPDRMTLGSGFQVSPVPTEVSGAVADEYQAVLTVAVGPHSELAVTHVQIQGRNGGGYRDRPFEGMPQGKPQGSTPGTQGGPPNPNNIGPSPGTRGPGQPSGGGPGGGTPRGERP